MFSAIASEPVSSASSVSNYRVSAPGVERNLLPQAAPAAPASSGASNDRSPQNDNQGQQQQPAPEPQAASRAASMFAAAILSGTLSPRPQSVSDVYLRIGIAPISTDSEAKMKDLSV